MSAGHAIIFGQSPDLGHGVEVTLEHTWTWPPWASLLALFVLAVVVLAVYMRESSRSRRSFRLALAAIRITLLALLAFMMGGWMQHRHRTDLPDLIVALDDSQSMMIEDHLPETHRANRLSQWTRDAGFERPNRFNLARTLLVNEPRSWLDSLSQRYRIKLYLIGETARLQSTESTDRLAARIHELEPVGSASRLGHSLQRVFESQRGRPTAAVVLLTDGITTAGQTLSEAARWARRNAIPLFLVGLGDDQPPRDVRLSDLLVDDVVFTEDLVSFEFKLFSHGYEGQPAVVRLRRSASDTVLAQRQLKLPADGVPLAVSLSYRPQEDGVYVHEVEVIPLEGEVDRLNNRISKRIQVRSAAIRVLLVQGYPNYEFRFLKNLLGRMVRRASTDEKLIDLTTVLLAADLQYAEQDSNAQRVFPVARDALHSFDVLILGDVNPETLGRSVMRNIVEFVQERGGGLVLSSGSSFMPLAYRDTPLVDLLPLELDTATIPSPETILDEDFSVRPTSLGLQAPHLQLGDSADQSTKIWLGLPGLRWLLTVEQLSPGARVLLHHSQRTDSTGNPYPVVWMQFSGAGKVIFHATDETYRWSRFQGDDSYYSRYWLQTLRYLSRAKLLSAGETVEVLTDRSEYRQGDTVYSTVQFHDERLAPQSDDGVALVIEDEQGRRRQMTLTRESTKRGLFSGSLATLSVGRYRAWLSAPMIQPRPAAREFAVLPPYGEQVRLQMDSADLRAAAKISRGRFYSFDKAGRLPHDLPPGRQVRVESLPPVPIWNSSLLVATFVGLITAEWILRKRAGMV